MARWRQTKDGSEWDGNVPANYRTSDNPPRALGRWINRQRSAYGKDKIKTEYVEKLNKIGLKWSVHERRPNSGPDAITSAMTSGTSINDDATSLAPSDASSDENQDGDDVVDDFEKNADDKKENEPKSSGSVTAADCEGKEKDAKPESLLPESAPSNGNVAEADANINQGTKDEEKCKSEPGE